MSAERPGHTLILCVGSPLRGDDALGVRAAQALRARVDLPPGVVVIDGGTEGVGLIPVMAPFRRVIVVDAVQMGLPPGTVRRFHWDEVRVRAGEPVLSLHQSDLGGALLLAEALGALPPELVIYGVQPHTTDWDQPLSAAVVHALPTLLDALLTEVRSDPNDGEEDSDH